MRILENILKDKAHRKQLIAEFQQMIWADENANEVLSELAYDMDFYEPDDRLRKESANFYGEDQLEKEIMMALEKLASK